MTLDNHERLLEMHLELLEMHLEVNYVDGYFHGPNALTHPPTFLQSSAHLLVPSVLPASDRTDLPMPQQAIEL